MTEHGYGAALSASTLYGIEKHKHLFAAWAAGRAASVKGCRFSVEQGREVLEACGFTYEFATLEQLPTAESMDDQHRRWRNAAIGAAESRGLMSTHGVAAKLINIYLKSRFVCGGHHSHERVRALHPPIDDVLLRILAGSDFGGFGRDWRSARSTRWSRLDSDQYENVIKLIRVGLKDAPLWMIEQFWRGNQ
jgi:hypothetical protein